MHFNSFFSVAVLLGATMAVQGCVTAGYEGQVGTMISGDQIIARREANMSVAVYQTAPVGLRPLGEVSARRCHRSFVEDRPDDIALIDDLKLAAYAQGGDAISGIKTEQKNGLLANCWYVVEATALVWGK